MNLLLIENIYEFVIVRKYNSILLKAYVYSYKKYIYL